MRREFLKSIFDRLLAGLALLLTLPLLILIAIVIAVEDGFPVLFRQARVGRNGKIFRLLKFRSMRSGIRGTAITAACDPRVTRAGRLLRKYKLDELPQLWNVLRGQMSLVGPRPEIPAFVDLNDRTWKTVLSVKPGLTDLATLLYRDEEQVLSQSDDPERCYRESVLPEKLALNLRYLEAGSLRLDTKLLLMSAWYSFFPANFDRERLRRSFAKEIV